MSFSCTSFKNALIHTTPENFDAKALDLFRYQARYNAIYKQYITALGISPEHVQGIAQIPFLPIECFKYHQILTKEAENDSFDTIQGRVFESSGTTGQVNSKHYVADVDFYTQISLYAFEQKYGELENYHILALLPSYLERSNSSLVYMAEAFIKKSNSTHSGFYLQNTNELLQTIALLNKQNDRKILLIGVTFALLDLAEQHAPNLSNVIVMETGGMKGRRKELIREELHALLSKAFRIKTVHAEYGMTELRSQAYSTEDGVFTLPAWCGFMLRDVNDALDYSFEKRSGVMNFIDLANVESCAFIATQDLATKTAHNQFKILGRVDNSDLRGCNLMVY